MIFRRAPVVVLLALLLAQLPAGASRVAAKVVDAPTVRATLVQTIDTSALTPPSSDPNGIVYMPGSDRLLVSDAEVDEVSVFAGKNLYEITRAGTLRGRGRRAITRTSPPASGSIRRTRPCSFRTTIRELFRVRPGPDGQLGTSDDPVNSFSTSAYGNMDPEDVAYDSNGGHLFLVDGSGREVFDLAPGPNGVFDGVPSTGGDDVPSQFDVGQYGLHDPEGIGFDAARDTLLVTDQFNRAIYELTKDGQLIRIIDISAAAPIAVKDVTLAPASAEPQAMSLWIADAAVDNIGNPTENDGKLYEMSVQAVNPSPGAPSAALLDGFSNGTDLSAYTSPNTKTPDPNRLLVAFIGGRRGSSSLPPDPILSGYGLTWSKLTVASFIGTSSTVSRRWTYVYVAKTGSSPTADRFSVSFGGTVVQGVGVLVVQIDGADLSGSALGAFGTPASASTGAGVTGTSLTVTLGSAPAPTSAVIAAFHRDASGTSIVPGPQFTELGEIAQLSPNSDYNVQFDGSSPGPTANANFPSSVVMGVAVEVKGKGVTNAAPVVDSVAIDQAAPRTNDVLTVSVQAHDPDGDPVALAYQWLKNGVELPQRVSPTLNLSQAGNGDKGDDISVRVTPSDGVTTGDAVTSQSVTVVNSDPSFNQDLADRRSLEGESVNVSAAATDADADPRPMQPPGYRRG